MAITILNPARFNGDGGLGTRRFVRAAFFDEGYGSSNRLSAYAQGAGIVPATAAFNQIGAGTVGDPLRLSQFSNFTVPSFNIVNISNHSMYVARQSYGDGPSSALAELSLSPTGVLSLLGSTAYYSIYSALGEINLDGSDYFEDTEAGSTSGVVPIANEWLQSGTPSLYSARATILSGSTPNGSTRTRSGTFGSWLPLTSTISWILAAYSDTSSRDNIMNNVFTLDIALTSDTSTIIDTATITITTRAQTASGDLP